MTKILLTDLQNSLPREKFALLIGLGFDERSLSVLSNVDVSCPSKIFGILNPAKAGMSQTKYHEQFLQIAPSTAELLGEGCRSIIEIVDILQARLYEPEMKDLDLVVDITSLTHELLVAIIGLLASEKIMSRVTLLYTGADQYSFNTSSEKAWLSRGVVEIRSVLGFPGVMLPSKKLHLIIMAGFEIERAVEVIRRYEPAKLTIGYGAKSQSVSEEHHEVNKVFATQIEEFLIREDGVRNDLHHFEFSCVEPYAAKNDLIEFLSHAHDENIVICPLNTKLSTVGAALAALELPNVQICYAQPAEYNFSGYAKPGAYVTVVRLDKV
ncbi:hypothetical protein PflCFBP13517_17060 [Pseudomonas fluorescens]|nr:hypothetical protein PflCFBP13517_17060 [Pseudomonas fluorescens]